MNTLSPCSSLSRQQSSNPLQMHTSNYYKLGKKKMEQTRYMVQATLRKM